MQSTRVDVTWQACARLRKAGTASICRAHVPPSSPSMLLPLSHTPSLSKRCSEHLPPSLPPLRPVPLPLPRVFSPQYQPLYPSLETIQAQAYLSLVYLCLLSVIQVLRALNVGGHVMGGRRLTLCGCV